MVTNRITVRTSGTEYWFPNGRVSIGRQPFVRPLVLSAPYSRTAQYTNYVTKPDPNPFDTSVGFWLSYSAILSTNTTLSVETLSDGTKVFRVEKNTASANLGMTTTAVSGGLSATRPAGSKVTIQCEVFIPTGSNLDRVNFIGRDDTNNDSGVIAGITDGTGNKTTSQAAPADGQWHLYWLTFVVPAGRNLERIYLNVPSASLGTIPVGQFARIRHVMVSDGDFVPFFSGATQNTPTTEWVWAGSPYASASIQNLLTYVSPYRPVVSDPYSYRPPLLPLTFPSGRVRVFPSAKRNLTFARNISFLDFPGGRSPVVNGGAPAVGSLAKFSFWPLTGTPDPSKVYAQGLTTPATTGSGQPWARFSAQFAVSDDARYIGVGARVNGQVNTGQGVRQYVRKWQLERAPVADTLPTTYSHAREVRVKVMPDRLNYSPNPAFWVDTSNWTGVTRTAASYSPSGFVGQFATNTVPTHTISKLKPNRIYTISFYTTSDQDVVVTPTVVGGTLIARGSAIAGSNGTPTRGFITFRVSNTGNSVTLQFAALSANTFNVRVGRVLMEAGSSVGAYFDGSTNGDCMWETGGVVGSTRAYYYQNRAERYAAMLRILDRNVPMGIKYMLPQFGVLPVN